MARAPALPDGSESVVATALKPAIQMSRDSITSAVQIAIACLRENFFSSPLALGAGQLRDNRSDHVSFFFISHHRPGSVSLESRRRCVSSRLLWYTER